MTHDKKIATKWEMAAFAFLTGFNAHAHTSSSLGVVSGTLAVCALIARAMHSWAEQPVNASAAPL
ncbi:MAG: hypothetical protein ACREX4_24625 [Gammaproteobacteria bacterium]